MQKKSLKLLLGILFILSLSSCASMPDVPVCAEISLSKGICTYTGSGKTVEVDDDNPLEGETWWQIRQKVLSMPAKSMAKIKAYMIKTCKQYKCNVDISSICIGI